MPSWRNSLKGGVSGNKLEILKFSKVRNNKKIVIFYSLNLTKKSGMCVHFTKAKAILDSFTQMHAQPELQNQIH